MSEKNADWLEVVNGILFRCWIYGFVLLLIWFVFFMAMPQLIYGLHGTMFGLAPHELNVIHYCGMGLTKLIVVCFFFVPWLAIKTSTSRR